MASLFKHTRRLLIVAFLFLLSMNKTYASHYAAVDIVVQYAGTGPTDLTYKVIVDLYFACETSSAPPTPAGTVYYFSKNAGDADYATTHPINTTWDNVTDTVSQLCAAFKDQNSCKTPGSKLPGFKRLRSVGTVTLPSQQSDWVFFWSSGARNGGIKNITTTTSGCSPQGNIFVDAGLDNLVRYDNNTPTFNVMPLPYICVNQPAIYLNSPLDLNNDSLVTTNVIPRQTPTGFYGYCPGYSAANPIQSLAINPYTVNPATGTATFTVGATPGTGVYVLAFRLSKYDRKTKKLIGFANRDVQVSVLDCQGGPPAASDPQNITFGELSGDKEQFTSCSGVRFDFDINGSTTLPNRNLYMTANLANFPGASLNVTGQGTTSVKGTFSWTPHYGNIGEHVLIVTVMDSTCDAASPIVFKQFRVILLKVLPNIDAGPDKPVCFEGGAPVEIFVKGGDNYKLTWTDINGGDPKLKGLSADTGQQVFAKPLQNTTYVVSTKDVPSICKNKDEVTVYIDTNNRVDAFPQNPVILCRPDYLQLEDTVFGDPPITPTGCANPSASISNTVAQIGINGSLGTGYDTLGPVTATFPNSVRSVKQQFLIRKAELFESGLSYGAIKAISFKANSPADPTYEYSNFKIAIKCTDINAISRLTGFQTGLTTVYTATGPTTIADGWNTFQMNAPYAWDTGKNLLIEICYGVNATVLPPGNDPVITFVPTDYLSSIMYAPSTPTSACPVLSSTDITQNFSRPYFRFDYSETVSDTFEYIWYPSTFLSDSTIQQPLAYVPRTTKYYVQTMGRSGCIIRDSVDIYVPVHNYSVTPADTSICFGETAPLRVLGGSFTYKWFKLDEKGRYVMAGKDINCWDCSDVLLKPEKTTTYKIAVYDSVWCIDTITAKITVLPLPDVKILTRDTFVKYGQSIQLLASGAKMYNWTPVGSLNNANVSYPVTTPTEPTQYIAGGIGANGCRAFDTLKVDVDYRDNLFIPSGFSPNGDGKNDLFKVSNLTFQRIVEFRVFNRWGQEVFNANSNVGWDGAWKGEPQDMGEYSYQIRIGFPDGYVESYKGTVTLIR